LTSESKSNHAIAPLSAAFVKEFREVFGEDVKVVWIRENGLEMGKRQ
jgi:hypothetical protein